MTAELKFIVDCNVGKLAKWLRMMGYDALFFDGEDDSQMVSIALEEGRIILTRDTLIMKRRVVAGGQIKALLMENEEPEKQIRQVIDALNLNCESGIFTICMECNTVLESRQTAEVKELVPAYVFKTQSRYRQCPGCQRIYWRGTHWQRMTEKLRIFSQA